MPNHLYTSSMIYKDILLVTFLNEPKLILAGSAEAEEYTDCISAEG